MKQPALFRKEGPLADLSFTPRAQATFYRLYAPDAVKHKTFESQPLLPAQLPATSQTKGLPA
jgi:hypothetical protein